MAEASASVLTSRQSRLAGGRPWSGVWRLPRPLHPVAWWVWAVGLAVAVSRTTNPILVVLVLAVLGVVVANRRGEGPRARAFKYYLVLAAMVVGIRVGFRAVFGGDTDVQAMHVLVTLPHLPLPSWAAGVQIGGPVTLEGTVGALYDGLRLGTLLCCLGAANSLANPKRALRVLPGALYELGVAVVVSITVAPQLVESVQRVRRARKLRGGATRGFRVLRSIVIPVMEDALERSLQLAAAMDTRGYGRTSGAPASTRRLTALFMILGLCGLCVGSYGLLDATAPRPLGVPALAGGSVLCVAGLVLGGRRVRCSHYRPDPWQLAEWLVVLVGVVPAVVLFSGVGSGNAAINPSTEPLVWPTLPLVPMLGICVAALASVLAPPRPSLSQAARDTSLASARRAGVGCVGGRRASSVKATP